MTRFGILWPDGTFTGGITDTRQFAVAFAKDHRGTVYEVGGADDPEAKEDKHETHS